MCYTVRIREAFGDQMMLPTSLDPDKAGLYVGVSKATLRAWKRKGIGPAYFRAGKLIRYRRSDLDAWIDRHKVTTENDTRRA